MKQSRFIALLLSLALLCALCGCVIAPAVSEPESKLPTTTATAGTTTAATETPTTATTTKAPETTGTTNSPYYAYGWLYPSEADARATYAAYQKMSYKEYFSEPRIIFKGFHQSLRVEPLDSDPTKIVDADNHNKVYFDAKKYKKDAKRARGGYKGDGIVDYFCVDGEIWRWHIPSDTVDVVIKHDGLYGFRPLTTDFGYCFVVDTPDSANDHPGHYHVISKNLTIPFDDIGSSLTDVDQAVPWLEKNVYNKK